MVRFGGWIWGKGEKTFSVSLRSNKPQANLTVAAEQTTGNAAIIIPERSVFQQQWQARPFAMEGGALRDWAL